MRPSKIDLKAFLSQRNVPEVSPLCECGQADETGFHRTVERRMTAEARSRLSVAPESVRTPKDFAAVLRHTQTVKWSPTF